MSISDHRETVIERVHEGIDERLNRGVPVGPMSPSLSDLDSPLSDERIEQMLTGQISMVSSLEMICTDLVSDLNCPVTDDRHVFDEWVEGCDVEALALVVIRLAREAPEVDYWESGYAQFRMRNKRDFVDPPDVGDLDDNINYSPYGCHDLQVLSYDMTRFGCPPTADINEIHYWWSGFDGNTKMRAKKFIRDGELEGS